MSECLFVAVFFYQQIHSQHQLNLCYPEYSCEHAPILECAIGFFSYLTWGMFYKLQNWKGAFTAFVACESKRNLIIFPISLIKKPLFCDICCNLLMVLITIVSLSLSSNKLGNIFNCDINLLMPLSSLLLSNKRVTILNCLAINNSFWCHQKLNMWWISGVLFE